MTDEDLLTTSEAAAVLKVSPGTLPTWRYRRVGPPFTRVGTRFVRYRRADLHAWIEANREVLDGPK